jgi:prepilin-type processing-associated H-X9-DG protein
MSVTVYQTMITGYLCPSDNSAQLFSDRKWTTISNLGGAYTAAPTNYVASAGDPHLGYPLFDAYSSAPATSYWGCSGAFQGMFGDCSSGAVTRISDCMDGTSNTFLVGENSPNFNGQLVWVSGHGNWGGTTVPLNWRSDLKDGDTDPADGTVCSINYLGSFQAVHCYRNQYFIFAFKSRHPGGANFAFADGSVKFIKQSISMRTYCALGTRAKGEIISSDAY